MYAVTWIFLVAFVFSGRAEKEDFSDSAVWEKWVPSNEFSLFPTLPIAAPLSEDEKCRQDSRRLIHNLRNKTFWAMQMWDSSATNAFGVLHGNRFQLGNYDECLTVTLPLRAHYCIVKVRATVHLKEAFEGDPYDIDPEPNVTVWKKIQDSRRDKTKYGRDESRWGLCVPSSCNATEMEKAINSYLDQLNQEFIKVNGTTYHVEIPENNCSDGSEEEFSYGEIGFWLFTWILVILVGLATTIDLTKKKDTAIEEWRATQLLMVFSLKRNIKNIMRGDENSDTEHLKFFHGIRCVSIILITVDHYVAVHLRGPMFNRQLIEEALRSYQNLFLPHGDLLVDTFFYMSGFLVTYILLSSLTKKKLNWLTVILQRFTRLAPLYFYIIWFQATAFLRFGSGPVWKTGLTEEVEFCRKNWWANVLFLQNYINPREMCMLHAWYLPCDMHFFIVTVFLIILITKNKRIGAMVLNIVTFITILIPGIVTYAYEVQPIISFNPKLVDKPRLDSSFEYLYVKSHTRAVVYFLGVVTAYYLFERRKSTVKISTRVSVAICTVGLGLLFAPMAYGSLFYDPRKTYNLAEATIFATLRRLSWGMAWVLFMIVNRFGVIPIFGNMFSWKISVPLSKITYGIYLIHFLIQEADQAKVTIPYQFISFDVFVKGTNDLFFAAGYAFVLYLVVELPFRLLFKELLFPAPKNKARPEQKNQEISTGKPDPNDSSMMFSIKL